MIKTSERERQEYNVKKLLALVMALMMLLCSSAVAEEIVYEEIFDGTWVQFEEGFELYLPSDWLMLEPSEEERAEGIAFSVCSPDEAYYMALAWSGLEAEMSIDELQAALTEAGYLVEQVEVNGLDLLMMGDAENDTLSFIGMDAAEPGYYTFLFTPLSDENLQLWAAAIASSLRNIQ